MHRVPSRGMMLKTGTYEYLVACSLNPHKTLTANNNSVRTPHCSTFLYFSGHVCKPLRTAPTQAFTGGLKVKPIIGRQAIQTRRHMRLDSPPEPLRSSSRQSRSSKLRERWWLAELNYGSLTDRGQWRSSADLVSNLRLTNKSPLHGDMTPCV